MWQLPFGPPPKSWPPVPPDTAQEHPSLADAFAEADRIVLPAFDRCDVDALGGQRRHRRFQLLMILTAMATSAMGAVQTALSNHRWPGVVVAVLGVAASAIVSRQREERTGETYLGARAKAEALRALYFRHLAGLDRDTPKQLESRVAAISHPLTAEDLESEEPT